MSTETPDAEAAWEESPERLNNRTYLDDAKRAAFLAGYAAGSARLDALHAEPLPADHEAVIHAEKQGHENGWNAAGAALRDMRDELSRSRAECQHLNDRLDEAGDAITAARAERDALRDAVREILDTWWGSNPRIRLVQLLSEAGERP